LARAIQAFDPDASWAVTPDSLSEIEGDEGGGEEEAEPPAEEAAQAAATATPPA
jgi:hypothetical protein